MSRAPSCAHSRRWVSVAVVALVAISSLLVALGAAAGPAAAAGENHAAVIVDTGSDVHQIVITFSGDSISGLEALQRAGADPAVLGFSGLGGAVCSLYAVGHPATNGSCLGEPSDPRFWAYWHVPAGQGGFDDSTYSRAGAGSVRVHDGDTEGWRFGTGEAPTFVRLALTDPDNPAPPPVAPVDAGAGPPGGPVGVVGAAPDPAAAAAGPSTTSSTTVVGDSTGSVAAGAAAGSTTSTTSSKAEVAAERASATRASDGGDGGGSMLSFVGFAAVVVVLAAGIFFARRARAGNRPSAP